MCPRGVGVSYERGTPVCDRWLRKGGTVYVALICMVQARAPTPYRGTSLVRNTTRLQVYLAHMKHTGGGERGDGVRALQSGARPRGLRRYGLPHPLQVYLTESVYKFILQKSISAQIRQLVLSHHEYMVQVDGFVRESTFARTT